MATSNSSTRRLGRQFFARPTLTVARELLGRQLVRQLNGQRLLLRVSETEAYVGEQDRACHAWRGPTPRASGLYTRPGTLYVYLVYGMHWCLNVVTEREGFPAAVLLRGAQLLEGEAIARQRLPSLRGAWLSGPGRLTRALGIDGALHGESALGPPLHFADAEPVADSEVLTGPRVGVGYAGEWAHKPWRFLLREDPAARKLSRR